MISNANAHEDTIIGSGFYVHFSAGLFMPTDTRYSVSGSGTAFGVTATGTVSGDVKAKDGQTFRGYVGRKLNKFFSIEGELRYVSADLNSASVDAASTLTNDGNNLVVNLSTDVDFDGDVRALSGMGNILIYPSRWKNYRTCVDVSLGFVN
jgi:hypothetical protein